MRLKSVLKEPLLHFALLGAAFFAVYSLLPRSSGGDAGKIVITQGQLESMVVAYTRAWRRPPTGEELQGLIRDRVREEVYYREALAIGLDKDDIIIRRRLRQKMEFLAEDVVGQAPPTDHELNAYLQANPDKFRAQPSLTFSQVYLSPAKHGANLARDAAGLLAKLNRAGGKANVSELGDSLMLDQEFNALPVSETGKLFGEKFAAKVAALAPGQWQGPIESGYGVHLVFVSERTDPRLPALTEVREAVSRDWVNARRLEANEKLYAEMLKRYVVTIESPQVAEETHLPATKAK